MRNKKALTTGDVAKYCGVSFRTVIRWIESGRLNAYRLPGRGDNRINVEEFLQFLSEHDMPVPNDLTDSQRRVLVVDPDVETAEHMATTLRSAGFEVETANDSFSAGSLLETFSPSVVTLDLTVPGLNGGDVLTYIRENRDQEQTRVLLVARGSVESLQATSANGADDFLQKPITDSILVDKVVELANSQGSRKRSLSRV